jgi:FAD/FMN-containing dehydrogenase
MTEIRADLFSPPGSPGYRAATTPHNATVVQRPAMVAHPRRAEEVAHTVQWAAKRNLRVAVQASGYGAGAPIESDQVLVDTSGLTADHVAPAPTWAMRVCASTWTPSGGRM